MKPNAYFYWDENKRARFSPHDENIDVTSEQENMSRNKVKCFISSDYKFYSETLGKPGRSGHCFPYCNFNKNERTRGQEGLKWTCATMKAVLYLGSNNASVNRGVVKPNLLPAVKPFDFLFSVLHQLLSTGNDVRDGIFCLSKNCFEIWSDELIDAFDDLQEAQAEVDDLVTQNDNNDAHINTRTEDLYEESSRLTAHDALILQLFPPEQAHVFQKMYTITRRNQIADEKKLLK